VRAEAWASHSLDSRDEPRGLRALLHKASLPHVRHSVSRLLAARRRPLDHVRGHHNSGSYNHLSATSSSDSLAPLTTHDDDFDLSTSAPSKQAPEGVSKLSLAGLSNGQCDAATDVPADRPQTSFRGTRPSDAYGPASHLATSHNDGGDGESGTVVGTGALSPSSGSLVSAGIQNAAAAASASASASSPCIPPTGVCHTPRTFRGDLVLALSHDGGVPLPPSGLLSARERPPPEAVYYPKPPLSHRGPPKRGVEELQMELTAQSHTPRTFRGDSPLTASASTTTMDALHPETAETLYAAPSSGPPPPRAQQPSQRAPQLTGVSTMPAEIPPPATPRTSAGQLSYRGDITHRDMMERRGLVSASPVAAAAAATSSPVSRFVEAHSPPTPTLPCRM
jgi:hypothetical protein